MGAQEEHEKKAARRVDSTTSSSSHFSNSWCLFWACFMPFRLANALLVQTYFNADEYWQSLEVAHRLVFGYGYLTWEWREGVRGYLHPLIFAALYRILQWLKLDTPYAMLAAPRLLQGVCAAVGDVYTYKLARRLFGPEAARWAVITTTANTGMHSSEHWVHCLFNSTHVLWSIDRAFCGAVSWFNFFCAVRTLSNSLEATLTAVVLALWPWPYATTASSSTRSTTKVAVLLASIAFVLRPTSAITWLMLGAWHLTQTDKKLQFAFQTVAPIGLLCVLASTVIDRFLYGSWVIAPLNFLRFNLAGAGGDFYGTHPCHWYFSSGVPTMLATLLPLALYGVGLAAGRRAPAVIALGTVLLYSCLGHKEFRFLFPMMPIAVVYAGRLLKIGIAVLVVTQAVAAAYFSAIHQRGTLDVVQWLAKEAAQGRVRAVHFLTPCHVTPLYCAVHAPVQLRILDCSPSDKDGYIDEADRFKLDPLSYLYASYAISDSPQHETDICGVDAGLDDSANTRPDMQQGCKLGLPSHFVLFDGTIPQVSGFLQEHGYTSTAAFPHAQFAVDRERQAVVHVFQRHTQTF
eukprot:jgi/Chlat1/7595/Chrsp64S07151